MPFNVYKDEKELGSHACYGPALEQARNTVGSCVVYVGIRYQSVLVWPLPPLKTEQTEKPYEPEYN